MTNNVICAPITSAFEAHEIDPPAFHHAEHVRVAFDLLGKYDFIEAAAIYAKGIRAITQKAGVPQKFNLTITYAFMSLIAERFETDSKQDFDVFVSDNPDLMSPDILANWYRDERLNNAKARAVFLLPDVA